MTWQVSGVANGLNGSIWVFHRAERLWDGFAYKPDWEHINYEEPIAAETLLQLDRDTGESSIVNAETAQIPCSTPAWDTFRFILDIITKFCGADPSEIQPKLLESTLASRRLHKHAACSCTVLCSQHLGRCSERAVTLVQLIMS